MRDPVLVSACLLGLSCRYDGCSKPCEKVLKLAESRTLIPFCPEIFGGLPTPRPPAECRDGRVINCRGADVTAAYRKGAAEALRLCRILGCKTAVLKAKSPACGCGRIYDGSFSGHLTAGDGIAAALLKENGIAVLTENDL